MWYKELSLGRRAKRHIRQLLTAIVVLFLGLGAVKATDLFRSISANIRTYNNVVKNLLAEYVDDIDSQELITASIEGMLKDGERLPEPTPWETLPKEKFTDDGKNLVTLVEAAVPGPSRRANITIEESLLEEIDAAAAALGTNRSAFLCEAARWKLDQMLERRLDAAMRGDARMVDVLRRLAAEDEKASSRKRHPPGHERRR